MSKGPEVLSPAPVDTYLLVGTTSLAQRLPWMALRHAASLQAGQTALVGCSGLGTLRVGWPARAQRGRLGLAQAQQVPIFGRGCMEACWFHGYHLLYSLPGREGEARQALARAALCWEPSSLGHTI